jgi:hypothetical protein
VVAGAAGASADAARTGSATTTTVGIIIGIATAIAGRACLVCTIPAGTKSPHCQAGSKSRFAGGAESDLR